MTQAYTLRTGIALFAATFAFFAFGIASAAAQVVQNGDFENPGVTDDADWEIHVTANVPGWTIEWMPGSGGGANDEYLEFHRGVNGWLSNDGEQYVELDTDWDGPDGNLNGEAASVRISQEVETKESCTYDLTFSFSPRPGTNADNNVLGIVWNGSDVDEISADGSGNNNTDWNEHTYQVVGTGLDTLAFEDRGEADSLGTFLDSVSLEKVSCPTKTRGDDSVYNSNTAKVINKTEADASTGGNYAGGSEGGNGGNGGDIENEGGDQEVDDSDTGNGGNGGNGSTGGYIETGDAVASAATVNTVNTNVTRIDRCGCGGDDKGDTKVRNRNHAFLYNETEADARTGRNVARGSEGGNGGNGGDIENEGDSGEIRIQYEGDYGDDDQDVDDSGTGNGGRGGSGGTGGTVFSGRADSLSTTHNDVNRSVTRIRR